MYYRLAYFVLLYEKILWPDQDKLLLEPRDKNTLIRALPMYRY